MTTTAEKKTESPIIETFKSECSVNGKKLLESAEWFAKRFKHDLVGVQDIATALFWNMAILEVLENLNISSPQATESFVETILSGRKNHKSTGSTQDIFNVALKESKQAGASKIRAGDIMVAILESTTTSGEALKEALSFSQEKGVSFLTQVRNEVRQVEKPWAA